MGWTFYSDRLDLGRTFLYPVCYQVRIVFIPDFLLFAALAGWAITQVLTLYAAKWVIGKAREESQTQKDEVVEHFDEKLGDVEGRMEGQLESFEGRFSEAYKTDMQALPAAISTQVKMTGMSEKGVETKALQAYLDKEGVEIDQAMDLAQVDLMEQDPQMMLRMALQKAYDAPVSDKFRKENPIKAGIWDFAKVGFASQIEQAFLGTSTLGAGKKRGNVTNPYGL